MIAPEPAGPRLVLRAPCKINLSLEVLGRRPDGYHEIRTIMHTVDLCDELAFAVRLDGALTLSCDDPAVPADGTNLVLRAAHLLRERGDPAAGAAIALRKRVPPGGGLGGGSADAAITLLALRDLWELRVTDDDLAEMAARLGSDVPFFLRGGTALCEGRGERVSRLPVGPAMHFVLVMPDLHVSTREVYAACGNGLTTPAPAVKVQAVWHSGDIGLIGGSLRNDLEARALALHARLREIRDELDALKPRCRAQGVSLSGSGAAFCVLVEDAPAADRATGILESALGVPCVAARSHSAWDFSTSPLRVGREES